jgi:hypothetical protein
MNGSAGHHVNKMTQTQKASTTCVLLYMETATTAINNNNNHNHKRQPESSRATIREGWGERRVTGD